jgi:uncharacterized membrane protein YhhN
MRPSTVLWLSSVAVAAGFAMVAAARNDRSGYCLFKPLTTFIILLGAAWLIRPAAPVYRSVIVLGLALSLAGDVLLLPARGFLAGLAAFLLAHVAYLYAFSLGSPVQARQLWWLLPFLAAGAGVLAALWRRLGAYRGPAVLYLATIAAMAWRAAMRGWAPTVPRSSFVLGLVGACLFMASDAVVALRRFGRPFPGAHSLELATYWAAQTLIALSVRVPGS